MCNQLKVEFFKLRHFLLLYIAAAGLAVLGFAYGYRLQASGYGVHDVFASANCDTSFMFLLAMVSAWFIGNDFSSRTIHHEITLGYSRLSVILVRELSAYVAALVLHLAYVASSTLGAGYRGGFPDNAFGMQDVFWCVTILLQLIALQSIVAFISFLCAKAAAAICLSVCFIFITCNIFRNFLDGEIFTKSCFCLVRENTSGMLFSAGLAAVITAMAMLLLTYVIFRKKEIR